LTDVDVPAKVIALTVVNVTQIGRVEMNPYVMQAVAAERVRDMHLAAARYHRATLARSPRPARAAALRSTLAQSSHALREWVRRGQLGPVAGGCATC
jgi:hypothetical protein